MNQKEEAVKYIKDNINLIDSNNFEELYDSTVIPAWIVGEVTALLLEAGIDPLLYIDNIPRYYLDESDITSFVIPKHIKSIGGSAFYDCTSLKAINYSGTIDQWKKIDKSPYWSDSAPIKTIHCIDGDIEL